MIGGHFGIVGRVQSCYRVTENGMSVGCRLNVVFNTLQPEPDGVTAIVPRAPAPAKQVRNQPVAQAASVAEDQDARVVEPRRYQH